MSQIFPLFHLSFKSDKKFKYEGWICPDCRVKGPETSDVPRIAYSDAKVTTGNIRQPGGYLDSQEHVKSFCPANDELRKGKHLDNLQECVTFFRQVTSRRQSQTKIE